MIIYKLEFIKTYSTIHRLQQENSKQEIQKLNIKNQTLMWKESLLFVNKLTK